MKIIALVVSSFLVATAALCAQVSAEEARAQVAGLTQALGARSPADTGHAPGTDPAVAITPQCGSRERVRELYLTAWHLARDGGEPGADQALLDLQEKARRLADEIDRLLHEGDARSEQPPPRAAVPKRDEPPTGEEAPADARDSRSPLSSAGLPNRPPTSNAPGASTRDLLHRVTAVERRVAALEAHLAPHGDSVRARR